MRALLDELERWLARRLEQLLRLRQGTVTDITNNPDAVTVQLATDGDPVPGVRYLASYTPTVGDTVFLLEVGPARLVLGTPA